MSQCAFFESETWAQQCWETAARSWTVDDARAAVSGAERVADGGTVERALDREVDGDTLLADVVDEGAGSPVDREAVVAAWRAEHDLPDACPHDPWEGDRCLFHAPVASKSPGDVTEAFRETVGTEATERRAKQFVGARLGEFGLEHGQLDAADNFPIDLSYAVFEGDVDLTDTVVNHPVYFDRAHFCAGARFLRTEFENLCSFVGTRFDRLAFFEWAEFASKLEFEDVTFEEGATFTAGTFHGDSNYWDATVRDDVEFKWVDFHGYPDFEGATFGGEADFGGATFHDDAGFVDTTFRGHLLFRTDFGGFSEYETHVHGVTDFRDATFTGPVDLGGEFGGPTTFENATFYRPPDFTNAQFDSRTGFRDATVATGANFSGVEFRSSVDFSGVGPTDGDRLHVDFTGATIESGSFVQPRDGTTYYDFTRATVGDVDLKAADDDGGRYRFDVARFDRTEFEGFDFTEYKQDLAPAWTLHDTAGGFGGGPSSPGDREATYLKAKNGAKDVGDGKAAAEFFLNEMRYRRAKHWANATSAGVGSGAGVSAVKWLSNWLYNLSCGYGERPLRTFAISLCSIVAFAGVFRLLAPGTGGGFSSDLELSFQSFVALVVGRPPTDLPVSVRLLASFEAFIGAFLIALFVFTLTRSIHR